EFPGFSLDSCNSGRSDRRIRVRSDRREDRAVVGRPQTYTARSESLAVSTRRGIRWHLFQVQLVSIVPIGLFAAALLYLHWQVQENERERSQMESVRLMAAAVDNALDSTVERLSIFARLWSSTDLSEEEIHGQAREALGANADWRNIVAFGADGHGVFRTDIPFGDPVPATLHPEL